jgi:2-C-methyl-D-erythritol 4-phosphate cytidylyltransferase
VILAAGSGRRFGDEKGKKQFVPVCSEPVLVHTLRAFEACDYITEIVVVTAAEDIRRCEEYRDGYGFTKVRAIIAGGEDRQASAKKGFDAISDKAEFVAIHDGARCLVTPDLIAQTVRSAYRQGAAVAAEKSRDTVKRTSAAGVIEETMDRETVWLAKTPQVFLANMYRAAVYTAEKDGFRATDDSSLVERLGFRVRTVDCGGDNIKLTTPVDVYIAEAILRARKKEE